jgi:hypothetical protein
MVFSLIPREKKFFDLFEALTGKIVEAAEFLNRLKENYNELPQLAKNLEELENETDTIVHQIYDLTSQTFVTPFDGEDIRSLAHNVDNVIDNIEDAVFELNIAEIEILPPIISEFSDIVIQTAKEVKKAMDCLRNVQKRRKDLSEYCIKINELENRADKLHRAFRKKIAQNKPQSLIELHETHKLKAILNYLEEAMDQSEDVANILDTIVLKYT